MKIIALILLLLFGLFTWATAPIFHPITMLIYTHPLVIIAGLIFIIFSAMAQYTKRNDLLGIGWILLFILLFVGAPITQYIAMETIHDDTKVDTVNNLSEVDINCRNMPKKVAENYMLSSLQTPKYTIYNIHATGYNKTLYWYGLLEPEGLVNIFSLKPKGYELIPMNATERIIVQKDEQFENSPNIQLTDNLYWKLYRHDYFADYGTPKLIAENGEEKLIIPKIKYHFHGYYTTPYWAGVVVVDKNGNLKSLSPKEALKKYPYTPIYPEELSRIQIESQNYYKDGFINNIMNLWFVHENEIELVDLGDYNKQPFLITDENGKPYWVFCVEPYGRSHGVSQIFFMSMDGSILKKSYTQPKIGPIKCIDYVKKSLPTYDWSQFEIVEPLPIIKDGKLYWKVFIIPTSGSGVSKIMIVDADSGDVELIWDSNIGALKDKEANNLINENANKTTVIGSYVVNGTTHWVLNESGNIKIVSADEIDEKEIVNLILSTK